MTPHADVEGTKGMDETAGSPVSVRRPGSGLGRRDRTHSGPVRVAQRFAQAAGAQRCHPALQYVTRPAPAPKPPVACRARALAQGTLVGVERAGGGAREQFDGLSCAVSSRLLLRVRSLPAELRPLRAMLARADAALRQAQRWLGGRFMGAAMLGFAVDFDASLPLAAGGSGLGLVRLHCGPDESGALCITLGQREELAVEAELG